MIKLYNDSQKINVGKETTYFGLEECDSVRDLNGPPRTIVRLGTPSPGPDPEVTTPTTTRDLLWVLDSTIVFI